jgi:hypothetical protein
MKCYKDDVVSLCSTETLFQDLLVTEQQAKGPPTGPAHTVNDLIKYTDQFFKNVGVNMTMKQFALFQRKEKHLLEKKKLAYKKPGNITEKQRSTAALQEFYQNKDKYKKVIQLAKEEWMLSTDGVVKALRFNAKEKQFMAKVHYKEGTKVKELEIATSDDWVFDTYGKEFANKLIDREEHQEFVKPLDESGKLALIPFDTRNITRVKYFPPKYFKTRMKGERILELEMQLVQWAVGRLCLRMAQ